MAKFYCRQCGTLVVTKPGDRRMVYCSDACHRQGNCNYEPFSCIHNDGVQCLEMRCSSCGWNPKVAQRRLEQYLKTQESTV